MRNFIKIHHLFAPITCLMATIPSLNWADPIVLESLDGTHYVLDVAHDAPFHQTLHAIDANLISIEGSSLPYHEYKVCVSDEMIMIKSVAPVNNGRSYAPPTESEKADIAFIVSTLADASLIKIKKSEPALKKAGERIDRVHPFQFLGYVFSDERLKVSMRNLNGRSWVWKEFLSGLTKSLADEHAKGNLIPYFDEFAKKVNVSIKILSPALQNGKWDTFIDLLIKNAPREGNAKRYDM